MPYPEKQEKAWVSMGNRGDAWESWGKHGNEKINVVTKE